MTTTAPVPSDVLQDILDKAMSAIQTQQKLFYPEWKLVGLRLGYWAPPPDSDDLGRLTSITWGELSDEPDSFVGAASAAEQTAVPPAPVHFPPLLAEYVHWLEQQCAQSLSDATPAQNLAGRELAPLLYANFIHSTFEIGKVPVGRCRCKNPRTGRWYPCPCP